MFGKRDNNCCFRDKVKKWKKEFSKYKWHILISIIIIFLATSLNYLSGGYTTDEVDVTAVGDLILDRFGPYDLGFLFVWGYMVFLWFMLIYAILFDVEKVHVVIIQFSLLVVIRAFFIILTHLQTPLDAIHATFPSFFSQIHFRNDMFFSGHVAFVFLGFLIYVKKKIKWFFLFGSFLMSFTVLAMHLHYSIDVFAAFFMTYCSWKIGKKILRRVEPKV